LSEVNPLHVIGLMSGTSLDGVDAAWIDTDGETIQAFGPCVTLPYSAFLRVGLRRILDRAPTLDPDDPDLRTIETELTHTHAAAIATLGAKAELIGFHGQTILHAPRQRRTWQIGDASALARSTGLPVVHDFRSADVEAGGEGAPFAPVFHQALAAALPKPLAVLNIGGVANVTRIAGDLTACDTGPGCALLDDFVHTRTGQTMDADGALAATGTPNEAILCRLLAHPYFTQLAPKSLDRQHFAHVLALVAPLSTEDGAATLAAFTARAVAACALLHGATQLLVTGGGRHNPAIMYALARALPMPVAAVESAGWDGDAIEAQCFAYLAVRSLRGLPLSFPGTTGVPWPVVGGRLVRPDEAHGR
jgi:anhydro-N-acetylmuramic acid kinase